MVRRAAEPRPCGAPPTNSGNAASKASNCVRSPGSASRNELPNIAATVVSNTSCDTTPYSSASTDVSSPKRSATTYRSIARRASVVARAARSANAPSRSRKSAYWRCSSASTVSYPLTASTSSSKPFFRTSFPTSANESSRLRLAARLAAVSSHTKVTRLPRKIAVKTSPCRARHARTKSIAELPNATAEPTKGIAEKTTGGSADVRRCCRRRVTA
mmetsp:Transcript_17876/g.71670  ORF Transcript_17876/g.71670 Transcript_17876/m.71670 type:complete len:216 (-) Transcript_17876:133-780(-)